MIERWQRWGNWRQEKEWAEGKIGGEEELRKVERIMCMFGVAKIKLARWFP